ncbi:hypothetical protein E4U13_005766 [Claviceps humidiphila]|uniref:V-type proton ATPase subunit G n=1 Tax=Claviceps humidiphila TaxID=1294629 RepID=A0A9P7Q684_9HYPO|nr:hypothetical protein E4U13_005766 [Claviceps humidiphila]
MPEDVSPDASPPPVGSTNRSKPHSKPMATGQCHPRPALLHLRLLIPSSNHHHISASFPHRVLSRYHLFPARLTPQPPITKKPLFYHKAHALPAMVSYTLAAARHLPTSQYIITNSLAQSAQNSAGIQTLLDAEREASKIVQKAREFRTKRVREARDEAKQEIADYKAKKEDEFQKFGAEHSKGNEQAEAEASKDAEKHIKTIKEAGSKGQASVVKNLLSAVFDVKPVAPAKQ